MLARAAARAAPLPPLHRVTPAAVMGGSLSALLRSLSARVKTSLSGATPESSRRQAAAAAHAPPLPASNESFWVASTRDAAAALRLPRAPPGDVDVLVLGGGIVGITTAYLLRQRGLKVGVLEAGPLCEGVTGHSTAKLTSQHGICYSSLAAKHGAGAARRYGAAQEAAKEWVASEAARLGIACDFERCETFVFGETPAGAEAARREADAAAAAGLPAYYVDGQLPELSYKTTGACGFRNQAVFHPRKWLLGLAARVAAPGGDSGAGSYVAEHVRATGLREAAGPPNRHVVTTSAGDVRARHVVVATHYPIFDRGLFFARLSPARDNCVAGPVDAAAAPRNAYWSADTAYSIRSTPYEHEEPGKRLVMVMGEKYRTGEDADTLARFRRLAAFGKGNWGLERLTHRWATHDLMPPDGLPYVGLYHPAASNLWVACGFKQWGMTMGTHAGAMLADLITSGTHPDADLFSPQRGAQLRAGAPQLAADTVHVGKHWVLDAAAPLLRAAVPGGRGPGALRPGEARVLSVRGRNVAAFRDAGGGLHCVGATCTHLGCGVGFNNAEQSWDCPCHGSRFTIDGHILHGPATEPLPLIDVEDV